MSELKKMYSEISLPILQAEAERVLERLTDLQDRYLIICEVLAERTADVVILSEQP